MSSSFLSFAACGTLHLFASTPVMGQVFCLFSEDFSGTGLPIGWSMSPSEVERLDGAGNGTGTFTAPFTVGTAAEANTLGYFPVPDDPLANRFVMANDDAPPCDCAMSDVTLRMPTIDLTVSANSALSFRFYHDGRPFNGRAWLEASSDGIEWTELAELTERLGAWQEQLVDLGAFDGGLLFLRFRYDDNGDWASGFAVDDVCVFTRLTNDIALKQVWLGDPLMSTFNTSSRSLAYTQLPVEQQTPLATTVHIRNLGMTTAQNITVGAVLTLNGDLPFLASDVVCTELLPLRDTVVQWDPGWSYGAAGLAQLDLGVSMFENDDQGADNSSQLTYLLTAQGQGGHAMAIDNDLPETTIGQTEGFSTGCRFELIGPASQVHGISVRFGGGTMPGTPVTALLMDGNLNLLSPSAEHVVTQADMDLSFAGGAVYLPLEEPVDITEDRDVVALIRFLGDTGALYVAAGGLVPVGAAWKIETTGLIVTYPERAPIVRIHLSEPATGMAEARAIGTTGLRIMPNPAFGNTQLVLPYPMRGSWSVEVHDAHGRLVLRKTDLSRHQDRLTLLLNGWSTGTYTVRVIGPDTALTTRLVVAE